jgi:hypothetical protein
LCFMNDDNIGPPSKETDMDKSLRRRCSSPSSKASVTSSTSSESTNEEDFFVNAAENSNKLGTDLNSPFSQLKNEERIEIAIEQGWPSSPASSMKSATVISYEFQESARSNDTGVKILAADDLTGKGAFSSWHLCGSKWMLHANFVPLVVAFTDITTSFAAGMSVRYFPIFFMKTLLLRPIHVQILYIVAPFGQIIMAHYAQKAGDRYGRAQTTFFFKLLGVALLFGMIFSYAYIAAEDMTILHRVGICVLYTLRTIFMNCTQGLTRSILMEAVPKEQRAKWSSLESLSTASWAASAYIGGILVARHSISLNFYVTAILQFCTTLPLIFLFKMA